LINLLRTWHILSFSILVGGIFFHQSHTSLRVWVFATIISGAALFAVDLYGSLYALFEIRGASIVLKILMLLMIPFVGYQQQVSLLFVIIVISSIVSHSTRRFRHRSLMPRSFRKKFAPDYSLPNKKRP
jgi:hypothetical protein